MTQKEFSISKTFKRGKYKKLILKVLRPIINMYLRFENVHSFTGHPQCLTRYESLRQRDNLPTMLSIDLMYKVYRSSFTPVQILGNLGLQLVNSVRPIKVCELLFFLSLIEKHICKLRVYS